MEMFRQMREMDNEKAARAKDLEELRLEKSREEEAARRKEDDENRRARREDEERIKEKKERQQEKLKGLGVYKEATELTAYLEKFERIMGECGVAKGEWSERSFPGLTERLCVCIAQVWDEGAEYEVVKSVLLKAVGENALTYSTQLFELSSESVKAKTAGEIMDIVERVCRGILQGCETVTDALLALSMAFTRKLIPPGGKVFLENRKITCMGE